MSLLLPAVLLCPGQLPKAGNLNGNNVICDDPTCASTTVYNSSTLPGLPDLPKGTRIEMMGPVTSDGYDGFMTIGGHLSLTAGASFYSYGKQMKRVMEIFADWVNLEHGGVAVQGKKYAIRFVWVDDRSSKYQTSNATAVALRMSNADFAWAGYSSGMTKFTAQQTYADGYLMMSGGAASTSVFTQNDMSFGLFPPASVYTGTALAAIAKAADAIDAGTSNWRYASRCGTGAGACKSSIRVGIVLAAAGFTRSQCAGAPGNARAAGLQVAADADGNDLMIEIPKAPTLEEAVAALTTLKNAGVNVVTSCTYSSTGTKLVEGLFNMSWAPYALTMSATIGTQGYADRVGASGGFKYEFALGYEIWHGSNPRAGSFTGMTSTDFVDRFSTRFDGAKPSYHGAAQFGVGTALVKAVELADSMDQTAVAAALRTLNLPEFYTDISFDSNGQLAADMLVVQFQGNFSQQESPDAVIVAPDATMVTEIQFPMPDWPVRICWSTCSKVTGHCLDDGTCQCDDGYEGANCENRVIIQEDSTGVLIMAFVLGPIVCILMIFGLWRFYLFIKKALQLKRKEEERKVKRCRQAIKAAVTLQSSAYLVSFNDFKNLGKLILHEEARKRGLLTSIDDYEDLVKFSTDRPVVFFSHQWLAWSEPDPDRIQYNEMIESCHTLCDRNKYDPNNLYIFLDILSIPQKNLRQRQCAIETLGCFASIFEHFIIIAPTSTHRDTKKKCDKASYGRRGWCRLEQWGHLCVYGTDGMYFYNANKLESLSNSGDDWFLDSIMVFEGDYTNPEGRAELVDTILGLYTMVLNGKDTTTKKLHELIQTHLKRVFPVEFFEDLPQMLNKLVNAEGAKDAKFQKKYESVDDKNTLSMLKKSGTVLSMRVNNVNGTKVAPSN